MNVLTMRGRKQRQPASVQPVLLTPVSPRPFTLFFLYPLSPSCFSNLLLQQDSLAEQSFHTFFYFLLRRYLGILSGWKKRKNRPRPVLVPQWLVCPGDIKFFFQKTRKNTAFTAYITTRWCWCLHSVWMHTSGLLSRSDTCCFSPLVISFQSVLQSRSVYLQYGLLQVLKVTNAPLLQVKMK